jgi:peptidoglycan/LPS O-acetylase OafA/YrhL
MTGRRLHWLAPIGGVGYIIFLTHPSVFAIAGRLRFHPSMLDIPGPLYIDIMLAVVTLFAFFVKKTLSDPIQAYGDKVVGRGKTPRQ